MPILKKKPKAEKPMLTRGNTKLGNIATWSIPPISTCPGSSELCRALCYATRRRYTGAYVKDAHARNLRACKRAGWVKRMIGELQRKRTNLVRVHAAGDFFSVKYIKDWMKISSALPHITFYVYTRSWSVLHLLPHICELAKLPNWKVWLSYDRDMPLPPRVKGTRICYLAIDDEDQCPHKVDLIFRNSDKVPIWYTPMKRSGKYNTLVCPHEQGIERQTNITCETCRICYANDDEPAGKVGSRRLVQLGGLRKS